MWGSSKTRNFVIILLIVVLGTPPLMIGPAFSQSSYSVSLSSTGKIEANINAFQIRGASVTSDVFVPTARNYNPNAWQLLKEAGINTICVCGGIEGNALGLNINNNPNTWAQNLDGFLSNAAAYGIKVYFGDLGDTYGSLFGIINPGNNAVLPATSISQAKTMINALAGNNSLGHNFITDPRILMWITSNETPIDNPTIFPDGTTILSWNLQLCDYIRSLGGKVTIGSPYVGDSDYDYTVTLPLIQGHVDYLDIHAYLLSQWYNTCNKNYTSFLNYYKNYLATAVVQPALQSGYSLSQVILGEFGLWTGTGTDQGITATFTDAERAVYYQAVFDAAKADGIQNVLFFTFFSEIEPGGTYLTPNYGVVANGTFYPNLYDIISNAYNP